MLFNMFLCYIKLFYYVNMDFSMLIIPVLDICYWTLVFVFVNMKFALWMFLYVCVYVTVALWMFLYVCVYVIVALWMFLYVCVYVIVALWMFLYVCVYVIVALWMFIYVFVYVTDYCVYRLYRDASLSVSYCIFFYMRIVFMCGLWDWISFSL